MRDLNYSTNHNRILKPKMRLSLLVNIALGFIVMAFSTNSLHAQSAINSPSEILSIELSDHAYQAVNSGVLLTIDCEFANIESWFFLTMVNNKKNHQFTLSRHTLSNRYIVKYDDQSTPHMFRSIPEALNFITSQALILLESYSSFDAERRMRISLNKFELPAPMRLQAFLLNQWDLDTGWLAWEYES